MIRNLLSKFNLLAKFKVKILLNSGHTIVLFCDEVEWARGESDRLIQYKISGIRKGRLGFVHLNAIDAITYNQDLF